ncbi:MAG: NAD(P)H-binding protein [Candidatus Weimeria sp.]
MKIFIAGGSGRVASAVIQDLAAQGHTIYAGSRHKQSVIPAEGVTAVDFDLHCSVDELTEKIAGMDAVYFLAGSRGKDLLQTDAFGAVKLMQACEKAGIRRYIQLSSIFSTRPDKWDESPSLKNIINYDIARFFADEWLIGNTDLDYTIVGPGVLEEKPGTGRITLNPDHDGANPIPDVAAVLAGVLDRQNTYKKLIQMTGGDTPIEEALGSV